MYCKNCGSKVKEGSQFCDNCGTKIQVSEQSVAEIEIEEIKEFTEKTNSLNEDQTLVEEPINEENEEIDKEQSVSMDRKKRNILPFVIIGIVVILAFSAFLIVKFVVFSPKNIFVKGIDSIYSNVSSNIDTLFNSNDIDNANITSLKSNIDFDITANENYLGSDVQSVINLLNDTKFEINGTFDPEKSDFDLNTIISNTSGSLQLDTYKRNNSVYLRLKDIYSKLVYTPIEMNTTKIPEINKEDAKYVAETLKNIFINSLDSSKFSQLSEKVSYNGKIIDTTKITYLIDGKEAERLSKSLIEKVKKDDKLLTILASYSNQTKEELITSLDEQLEEKTDSTDTDELSISIFTTGFSNDLVAYQMSMKTDDQTVKIFVYDYKEEIQIKLISDDMTVLTIDYEKTSDTESKITLSAYTVSIIINSVTENNKKTITISGSEITSGLDAKIILSNTNNSTGNNNFTIDLKLDIDNKEIIQGKINMNYEMSSTDSLEIIDTTNSISSTDLTETDYQEIMTNFQSNEFVLSLLSQFISINTLGY